ncbi:peptidase inhibitor family I36 protein [Streptomyces niveus]|uniref:peptidase inhibitor family I36 protein n=1 Tax=Streptomyces niveus TaxID=193462 RepID=UPI0036AA3629
MIKKTALALTMALAASVPLTGSASAVDPLVREIRGQGIDACPEESVCLYQDSDFNAGGDARIWILKDDVPQLSKYGANDHASSAYVNFPNEVKVQLFQDTWYDGEIVYTMWSGREKRGEYSKLSGFNDEASSVVIAAG